MFLFEIVFNDSCFWHQKGGGRHRFFRRKTILVVYVFFVLYIPIFLKWQSYILGVGPKDQISLDTLILTKLLIQLYFKYKTVLIPKLKIVFIL